MRSNLGEVSPHGLALFAYLQAQATAAGMAVTTWCRKIGISDSTAWRWSDGVEPDMRTMRKLAEGLGVPLRDILVAAKYLGREELKK